ncbi:MAG: aspartyl/asparaginyl beta-hydroxylase domain-containing protein [Flavobacteriales bacterium]
MDTKNPQFFYDVSQFPTLHFLSEYLETIKKELTVLLQGSAKKTPWMETFPQYVVSNASEAWKVFPFTFYTMNHPVNQQQCPETTAIIRKIPDLISCDFSRMKGKTRISPHTGYSRMILRCHFPVIVPNGKTCGITVGNEKRFHEEGQLLLFDDSYEHAAWNDSDEDRIVLMFDIPNPFWGYSAHQISQYKIETLDDPFLLGIASKEAWLEAFHRGVLPLVT